MRDAILVVIGVLIGLGVGYAVFGGDKEAVVKDTGGDGRDTWPLTQCPPPPAPKGTSTAKDKLDAISNLASAAQPQSEESNYCMAKAQSVQSIQPPDEYMASGHAMTAHQMAQQGDWPGCKASLQMIAPD